MIDREPHLGSHCDLARGGFRGKSFPQVFLSNVFSIVSQPPGLAYPALLCSLAYLCSHAKNRILSQNCCHADSSWILSRRGRA